MDKEISVSCKQKKQQYQCHSKWNLGLNVLGRLKKIIILWSFNREGLREWTTCNI